MNPDNFIELKSKSNVESNTNIGIASNPNSEEGKKLFNQITNIFKGITWENEGETVRKNFIYIINTDCNMSLSSISAS